MKLIKAGLVNTVLSAMALSMALSTLSANEAPVVKLCMNNSSGELKAVSPGDTCPGRFSEVSVSGRACEPWSVLSGDGECLDIGSVISSIQEESAGLEPRIQIQTQVFDSVSGEFVEADFPPGIGVYVDGDAVWRYVVTNITDYDLLSVVVRNSIDNGVVCTFPFLAAGESVECTSNSMVAEATAQNLGMVHGILNTPDGDAVVVDSDSAYILGGFAKTVFITSRWYSGILDRNDGLAGADAICATHALEAGLEGTYMAWLSDGRGNSPSSRFLYKSPVGYFLVDGTKVAHSFSKLNTLLHPINLDENGREWNDQRVWTNTYSNGNAISSSGNCSNWTYAQNRYGTYGWNNYVNSLWSGSSSYTESCYNYNPLYCFEQ